MKHLQDAFGQNNCMSFIFFFWLSFLRKTQDDEEDCGIPCFWNHSGIWNIQFNTGLTSLWIESSFRSGSSTLRSWNSSDESKSNYHINMLDRSAAFSRFTFILEISFWFSVAGYCCSIWHSAEHKNMFEE